MSRKMSPPHFRDVIRKQTSSLDQLQSSRSSTIFLLRYTFTVGPHVQHRVPRGELTAAAQSPKCTATGVRSEMLLVGGCDPLLRGKRITTQSTVSEEEETCPRARSYNPRKARMLSSLPPREPPLRAPEIRHQENRLKEGTCNYQRTVANCSLRNLSPRSQLSTI